LHEVLQLSSKLISALAGTFVSLTALPWVVAPASAVSSPNTAAATTMNASTTASANTRLGSAVVPAAGISRQVLEQALGAVRCAVDHGDIRAPRTLTVIDYSKPSTEPRLWVFDVATGRLLFKELVAHGRNTGENLATRFSDTPDSRQTSLGLFVAADTYVGSNGYSLRLDGLEPGFNGNARERAIVVHGAPYVSAEFASSQGRLGRSWGCPALREAIARQVIDTIRGGGVVFSYYPDQRWLTASRFLNCDDAAA
jgi:hypothetical protein